MDNPCITPRAATGAGELTTFYSYESGPARSLVLANMAWLLAGRQHATVPVLMIDWDLESPSLHCLFGAADERPGLLELIAACRDRYDAMVQAADGAAITGDPDAMARAVLDAVDWQQYVERVDTGRPLYLLRAGRFDDSYGERAAQLDWHALYRTCPALLRQLRIALAQVFRHVFIDARCGRSTAVSVCTALLPDKIVGLFTPHLASLDGLCGAVRRAIDFRCSHEEEQRPLLLYPLPCAPDGADRGLCQQWRRGAVAPAPPPYSRRAAARRTAGYQDQLEALMRASYARKQLSLERYCDAILLHGDAFFTPPGLAPLPDRDHVAPARTLATLLDWLTLGHLPWHSSAAPALARTAAPAPHTVFAAAAFIHASTAIFAPADAQEGRNGRGLGGVAAGPAQFPALRHLGELLRGEGGDRPQRIGAGRASAVWGQAEHHGTQGAAAPCARALSHAPGRSAGLDARHEPGLEAGIMCDLVDAIETQLDQLQRLVDQQALREARPLADKLHHLVLRPAVAPVLRRRGAALIKLVYRHDNDTDALLAFAQDEIAALERVLSDAAAGRPLAFS